MAVVTFGGAYAVLAYVAQEAVENYGWLRPGEMLDGLGMAETTPGPLIMVTQFVGFLGAFRDPGGLPPLLAGDAGRPAHHLGDLRALLPLDLPRRALRRALRGNKALSAALSPITAAVVGVILNLAIWFALHVLFAELCRCAARRVARRAGAGSVDMPSLVLTLAAALAMFRFKLGMIPVLHACAAAGAAPTRWRLACKGAVRHG